jgi:PKD repeat protein
MKFPRLRYGSFVLAALLAACSSTVDRVTNPDATPITIRQTASAVVPSRGSAIDLDIGTWNLEWFGDTGFGPTNETLQQSNARDVLAGADQDIWGLQEIVSASAFSTLVAGMPGYAGILANDPFVVGGTTYYNDFSNQEQKVALVYRTSIASVFGAKVILGSEDYNFAGRPPVEFRMHVNLNGGSEDIVVIVLHAKSGADATSLSRRAAASTALKNYVDTTWPTQKVWIIGDFNDDMDTSILAGNPSPYANFVNDGVRYAVTTKSLSDAGVATTVSYPDAVDHQIGSNEAGATYVAGSATAYRVDSYITNYGTTTSDHYPVLTRWSFGPGGATNQPPVAAFTSGCTLLACTFTDGSSDPDGTVASRGWSFGDGTTSTATSPSKTYAAAGTYSVQLTVTDNAGATNSIIKSVTVTSTSASPAQVIINEILANEPGNSAKGEAIELVNLGGTDANIGGWTVSDVSSVRHTFAAGTILPAGKAIAIYGGASAIPAGIVAVAASTGTLSLANTGDQVIVKNGATIVDQFMYPASLADTDGVSMNRSPDLTAAAPFVKHTTISALKSSIGKKANGTTF